MQLLRHDAVVRVDCPDNGGREEGEALDGDVVQQEDESGAEGHGAEDAVENLGHVELVEDFGRADALGLDARDCEVLFVLCQPACGGGAVRQREEGDDGEAARDDAFDSEDHAPGVQAAEVG